MTKTKFDCKPKKPYHAPPPITKLDHTAQSYADAMSPVYDEIIDKMEANEE